MPKPLTFKYVPLKPRAQFLGQMLSLVLDSPAKLGPTWSQLTPTAPTKDVPEVPLFPAVQAFELRLQGRHICQFSRQILEPQISKASGDSEVCISQAGTAWKQDVEICGARKLRTQGHTCFCGSMLRHQRGKLQVLAQALTVVSGFITKFRCKILQMIHKINSTLPKRVP